MPEFKCISCGETKQSEKNCSCPVCGYKMFEVPYERSEILKKEFRDFISRLVTIDLLPDYLELFRREPKKNTAGSNETEYEIVPKQKDDQRFPDFQTIREFVCSSSKTETFYERLTRSLEQIGKHIHEPYYRKYEVSSDRIAEMIRESDAVLRKVFPVLEIGCELPEIRIPELHMEYSETPNDELLGIAEETLEKLSDLSEKIKRFIKQNNIYGAVNGYKPKKAFRPSDKQDYAADLARCNELLAKVLSKKYMVDIFSDGSEELGEMLSALWVSIEAILTVPILVKKSVYSFPDGITSVDDNIKATLAEWIDKRYDSVKEVVSSHNFLSGKTDDELFEIYDRMIELDVFGYLGVNKNGLLKIGESEKKLNELIGLSEIKESVKKVKAYALSNKDSNDLNIHMCFLGNPGSGKTEVARIIAGILYENKILPTKKIVEVDRSGLVSQYFGATAEKTRGVIDDAMGGVLFIDEAYALGNNSDAGGLTDYGKEAIDTLVKAMEDYRGKFCVILAGYKNEMLRMLSTNPGFQSRIQFTLDFPNYSRDELKSIAEKMLKARNYTIGAAAMDRILDVTDVKRKKPNFANAREIRNILDQVIMCQNVRCAGIEDKEIGVVDVNKYLQDAKINLPTGGNGTDKKILSGDEELDRLFGLSDVKRTVRKIKAYAKRNKAEADFNLHMCFYGNPGTGKTEVARILSRILYDSGVLSEAKLVETDGQGLLGRYVGETGPKTEAKINDAMGGVLFIDEAYSLVSSDPSGATSYGNEAIAVLLKEMEDRRGQFCVILAGYKDKMEQMMNTNPGFKSRIQFSIEFPDYNREELREIARAFLARKQYGIKDAALEKILDITEYFRLRPNFANARTVRNILDKVLMNQNLRTEDVDDDRTVTEKDVEDYLADEKIDLNSPAASAKQKIGF